MVRQFIPGQVTNTALGSMANQKLNEFAPRWKEKNIFVVNASPLGMIAIEL